MGSAPTDASESIKRVYRECFSVASPYCGRIFKKNDKNFIIDCVFDSLDSDTLETKKTIKRYTLATTKSTIQKGCDIKCVLNVSKHLPPVDLTEFTSENVQLFAKLKSTTTSSGGEIPMLEIWARKHPESQHLRSIDISDLAEDYKNVDNTTNTFRWCPFGKQDKLLYICRSKPKNRQTKKPRLDNTPAGAVESRSFQNEHTVLRIIDVSKDCQTTTLDMPGFSLSDPRWMDNGDKVVSVACPDEPNRLSLIDGIKRPSKIVVHDVSRSPPELILELADKIRCFYSPRVDQSEQRFVCLTTEKNGHRGSNLCLYDIKTRKQTLLLENEENGFLTETEGSFIHSLPNNCFTENGKFILLDVAVQMKLRTVILNLEHSTSATLVGNARVLDFNHNIVLLANTKVDSLPNLAICVINQKIPPKDKSHSPRSEIYDLETAVACKGFRMVASRRWNFGSPIIGGVLYTCPDNINVLIRPAEPLRIFSSEYQDLPLVVLIHKAPHKFVERHMPWLTFFNRLGLITIMINHYHSQANTTKSFTQTGNETGRIDVGACLTVIREYIEEGKADSGLIVGGSHGNQCLLSDTSKLNFVVRGPAVSRRLVSEIGATPDCRCDEKHLDLKRRLRQMLRSRARWPTSSYHPVDMPTLILFGHNAQLQNLFHRFCWTNLLHSLGFELKGGAPDPNKEAAIWLLQHLPLSGGDLLV